LAGAGHCVGMCGGIAAALSLGKASQLSTTASYHLGRICSYTLLGGLLGFASSAINISAWTLSLRYLAGFLLIGMGLYIADWWRGMARVEQLGAHLWKPVQKLSSRWLPVDHWYQARPLGLCWGLMPCGLIYSSLAWAATANSAPQSAMLMFVFGLGTLPAMLATSLSGNYLQDFLRRRGLKVAIALVLICAGLWTLYISYSHSTHLLGSGSEHMNHSEMDHSKH
jgi:sulfite exporter TauE/SafE